MFRHLMRAYLFDRLMRGGHRHRSYGYGRRPRYYGSGRSRRHRGGLFPFPHYSTRTRRGSRVSVGGCCLPIPLGLLTVSGLAARALVRRGATGSGGRRHAGSEGPARAPRHRCGDSGA